ncbi:MAG: phage tail protein [Anaerovoracaceae bacterium]|jgi:hypothetical protein
MSGTQLATAYVQVIPSARGIKGSLTSEFGSAASAAGSSAGRLGGSSMASSLLTALRGSAIVAGVGAIFNQIIQEGAALEQSIGGIKTMFNTSSSEVLANAKNAWRTAGLSANQYMEQATSFSAALLQSLGGDTQKAAASADMAVRDMADNSNKFGTNIQSIQDAYQGFSKQNYTMLDNLKLGYGGTRTEMQRLLDDANRINAENGKNTNYSINNLNDVYSAIHVVQEEMNITGTTSKEAATTLTGSYLSMTAAAKNFAGYLVNGNQKDINNAFRSMISATCTFVLKNLIPAVGRVLAGIGKILLQQVPELFDTLRKSVDKAIKSIMSGSGDQATQNGLKFAVKLMGGILKGLAKFNIALGRLLVSLVRLALASASRLLSSSCKALGRLIVNLLVLGIKGAKGLLVSAGGFVKKVVVSALKGLGNLTSIGKDLIKGIWKGIKNTAGWFRDRIKSYVGNVKKFLKKLFKIGSPSKVMADEIGQYLPMGVAMGIDRKAGVITDAMDNAMSGVTGMDHKAFNIGVKGTSGRAAFAGQMNVAFTLNVSGAEDPEEWGRQCAQTALRELRMA